MLSCSQAVGRQKGLLEMPAAVENEDERTGSRQKLLVGLV